jgi:hypothetical protein
MLQSGPESNMRMVNLAFADTTFHQAFTELIAGWLVALAARQLRVLVDAEAIVPVTPEARNLYEALQQKLKRRWHATTAVVSKRSSTATRGATSCTTSGRQGSGSPKKLIL